jgi:hypothetical protein
LTDEDDQKITVDELLDNLVLDSKPDDANEVDDGDDEMEGNQGAFITGGERAARDNIGYVGQDEANNIISSKEMATLYGG